MSTHAGITEYANYVGGLVGYNGTRGSVIWDQYGTPTLGAILYGDTFVGGLAGYNDGNAAITNTSGKPLTIRGQIVADGDAVGGMIGLNTAPVLPTATVAATRVEASTLSAASSAQICRWAASPCRTPSARRAH